MSRAFRGKPTRRGTLSAALLVLAAAGCLLAGACGREPERVRVVLVTLDTLRWDSYAGAEGRAPTMPKLAEWARGAAVFESFFAASGNTQPSHASMLTGLHPWQHGVSRNGIPLLDQHLTVPERLRRAGFHTAAAVGSFPVSRYFGFHRGFDAFLDSFDSGRPGESWHPDEQLDPEEGPDADHFFVTAEAVTARGLGLLDAAEADRQFFWFHYFDPHSPYGNSVDGPTTTSKRALRRARKGVDPWPEVARARALYDVDVRFLDTWLGRLLDRLEADAAAVETHVLIASDHGESFGEGGSMAHGRRLLRSQLHVPCLLRTPRIEAGARGDVAGSIDVAATLMDLAGVRERLPGGRSLLERPTLPPRAFGMRRTFRREALEDRLDGRTHPLPEHEFFATDRHGNLIRGNSEGLLPGEGSNEQPDQQPAERPPEERTRDLLELFARFERELEGLGADTPLDPETEAALEALGYTQ